MKLTTADLQRFVGGQFEVQNQKEGYLYRGEIETIEVTDGDPSSWPGTQLDNYGDLKIKPRWMAKMADGGWKKDEPNEYAIGLSIYPASDIGDGRIHFSCFYNGEHTTLFPKGGSALDPAKVEGLAVAA